MLACWEEREPNLRAKRRKARATSVYANAEQAAPQSLTKSLGTKKKMENVRLQEVRTNL